MNPNDEMNYEPVVHTSAREPQPESQDRPEAPARPEPQAWSEPVQEPVYTSPYTPGSAGSTYHGAGAGQKESPYADSPYCSARPSQSQHTQYTHQAQPEPPVKEKKQRKGTVGKVLRGIVAAMLTVALVVVSCAVTAEVVNLRWETEMDELEVSMTAQIAQLQDQLTQVSAIGNGVSISGTAVSLDGLTPAQVYAMNVNSVVSISSVGYSSAGTGSGFILSEDGYIITNHHVVEGGHTLTVTTYMGDEYEATLVGSDDINDVALLKVDATGLDAVTIGSSDALIVGDQVVAIGNPLGELTSTQTVGYISGKDRAVSTDGSIINMLQTDAAINSGNSGGPLFNMKGEVVGITSAKYSGSSSSGATIEGIGFAIPIDDVMGMIDDFKEYGYLKNQAYLGVTVMDLDATTANRYSLPAGSYVETVTEGGSAHRAGVEPKDIIIAVGEYEVGSNAELTNALRRFSAGDTTTVTVYRGGQELELEITFDEKPQSTDTDSTVPTLPGEMPESGDYEDWYKFFSPFFG